MPASTGKSKMAFRDASNRKFKVPEEELKWIDAESRQKLFQDLCKRYQSRYNPNDLKLIYAALNYEPSDMIDYLMIFSCSVERKSEDGKPTGIKDEFIGFIAPFIYTELTIPGYRYALKQQKVLQEDIKSGKIKREEITVTPLDNFFTDSISDLNKVEAGKFYNEFVPGMLKLSNIRSITKRDDFGNVTSLPNPDYWKDPSHIKEVIHVMMNYSLYFNS